jgi:hypothetical protein
MMPQTIPSKEAPGEESNPTPDGRRLGLTLGLLTVCGFAGAQAVLVGLATDLVTTGDRDTAQSLLNFMNALGGGIGPAAVAGLSGIVPVPVALALLAALPLCGLIVSLTRRPGA